VQVASQCHHQASTWAAITSGAHQHRNASRSGDRGQDVITVKKGFGSVRLIESVKRYTPGNKTTAEEVQAFMGVLLSDPQVSKGIVSTTWQLAPMILQNPYIMQYVPHRLELLDREALLKRLKDYTQSEQPSAVADAENPQVSKPVVVKVVVKMVFSETKNAIRH
jgi:restriction endonuclease Mrr